MFDFSRLRRFPDVEAPNLQAWDATDELLVQWALEAGVPGSEIAVIGDEYGAITLALSDAGLSGIRVHQDLVTGRRALVNNARALGSSGWQSHELDETLLAGARVVLVQLPKSLAALEEIADAVARWAASDAVLVAGGRVKHMTLAQNDVLARHFAAVQPQRAARKSRLLVASAPTHPAEKPLPAPETSRHVISHPGSGFSRGEGEASLEFVLCAYGGAFAGAKLDIGTRALLDAMPALASGSSAVAARPMVVDLGCGTGALAVAFALQHPPATIIATDRSAAAVRSTRATVAANDLQDRITVTLDDAGSDLGDGSADLVLLNPPFHLGASVHEGAGHRLIEAAARLTREGGEVWTVFNSHLDHRRVLTREVGPTEQITRTSKFTVTRSIKRA
ncbi:methyltransferase [Microbacterium sp. H1-D42]|uniref:class I SAM-dependent methyltransferase n=1 Tax=Microbacterium sp. H1-D42 TaxID=2925844 RepID=UPI001F53D934|nr:methyltransferase [Microbacterium sp. H1-D42]UNK70765.1 methyltransferase [Microbacterium sp. H1-D42]